MKEKFLKYRYSILYFLAIVFTNGLFMVLGAKLIWPIPYFDGVWSPLAVVVGLWFILRDYAQEELGNKVLLVMLLGMAVSYAMAGPALAVASAVAFATGETIDWLVYTFTKRPFAQRVLISSFFSAPVDTFVFFTVADALHLLPGMQMFSWPTVLAGSLAKLAAAYVVYLKIKSRAGAIPHAA